MTILEGLKKGTIRKWFAGQGIGEMLPVLLGRMVMGLGSHEEGKAREETQEWLEQEDVSGMKIVKQMEIRRGIDVLAWLGLCSSMKMMRIIRWRRKMAWIDWPRSFVSRTFSPCCEHLLPQRAVQ